MKIVAKIMVVAWLLLTRYSANAATEQTSTHVQASEKCASVITCQPVPCIPQKQANQGTPNVTRAPKTGNPNTNIYIDCAPYAFTTYSSGHWRSESHVKASTKQESESFWALIIKAAKDIVPLFQTLLWLLFSSILIWYYRNELTQLINAIINRIISGSEIETPWFKLKGLQTQTPEQQAKKAERDFAEVNEPEIAIQPTTPTRTEVTPEVLRAKSFQAEDLALRAIQAEYGVPISRQLQAGQNLPLDGVFVKEGTAYIVEVKYSRGSYATGRVQMLLSHMLAGITKFHWRNVKLLLAVVYDDTVDLEKEQTRLAEAVKDSVVDVEIRCFSFKHLAAKFGIAQ